MVQAAPHLQTKKKSRWVSHSALTLQQKGHIYGQYESVFKPANSWAWSACNVCEHVLGLFSPYTHSCRHEQLHYVKYFPLSIYCEHH